MALDPSRTPVLVGIGQSIEPYGLHAFVMHIESQFHSGSQVYQCFWMWMSLVPSGIPI